MNEKKRTSDWQPWIDWVKAAMEARGLESIRQLALLAHLSSGTLSGNLTSKHQPAEGTLRKLADYFGVDLQMLRVLAGYEKGGPRSIDATPISDITAGLVVPFVEVSAGGGLEYGAFEVMYPPKGASHNLVLAHVRGDCMAPRIENGDIVLVDRVRPWQDGQVVLARVENQLLVKRAYRENGHIRLHADAQGYADIVDNDTAIIGPVIEIRRKPD